MERQLPLPRNVRAHAKPIPPLAAEHAVRVFEGLFATDNKEESSTGSQKIIPLTARSARTSEAMQYEARLRLQFFYGARQIVIQALGQLDKSGEPTCHQLMLDTLPSELPNDGGKTGADVLYMEVNYLALVMHWLRGDRKVASKVRDTIYERIYSYWPLPEFHPDRWTSGGHPLAHCRAFAQGWLYGNHWLSQHEVERARGPGHFPNARPFVPPLAEATVDGRVPADFPQEMALTEEQLAQIGEVYHFMQVWAIMNDEDLLWLQLYPTRHVLYLFLCACIFKLLHIQWQIDMEIHDYPPYLTMSWKVVRVIWAMEQRRVDYVNTWQTTSFISRKREAVEECLRHVFNCVESTWVYFDAQAHFAQGQALHRLTLHGK
jgi:hypothetical protein